MTISQTLTTSMPSPVPGSELARARAALLYRQLNLADTRLMARCGQLGDYTKESLRMAESNFLAALSWVWDAQERAAPPTVTVVTLRMNCDMAQIREALEKASRGLIKRLMPPVTASRMELERRFGALGVKKRSRARGKAS